MIILPTVFVLTAVQPPSVPGEQVAEADIEFCSFAVPERYR
jgi:hypothetical protein